MKGTLEDIRVNMPGWAAAVLAAIAAGNILALMLVGTHTDEAYYWLWSQRPDLGYFDHPPMIAWVLWLSSSVFGDNSSAIRLPALLAWVVVLLAVYRLSRELAPGSPRAPIFSVLLLAIGPLFQFGAHIITPDVPLMLFSALSFLYFFRALESGRSDLWLLAGIFIGLSALSKYNAILIPLSLLPVMLLSPKGRQAWTGKGLWMAIVAAAIVSLPVFYWNHINDWISIRFQLGHGTDVDHRDPGKLLGLYLSGQMANTLPWIFLLMVFSVFYSRRQAWSENISGYWFLVGTFLVPLVFFGALGTFSKSEPNWPAMAYLPASILAGTVLANLLDKRPGLGKAVKYFAVVSAIIAMMLVNLIRYPGWAWWFDKKIIPNNTQIAYIYGWNELGTAIRKNLGQLPEKDTCTVLSAQNLLAGQIAFQLGSADRISFVPDKRTTQFNIWMQQEKIAGPGTACLYVEQGERVAQGSVIRFAEREWKLVDSMSVTPPDRKERNYNIYVVLGDGQ